MKRCQREKTLAKLTWLQYSIEWLYGTQEWAMEFSKKLT